MRRLVVSVLTSLVLVGAPVVAHAQGDARGSGHAQPSIYSWLDGDVPIDTYTVIYVTGMSAEDVARALGTLDRRLGTVTRNRVERYQGRHVGQDYLPPLVAQVQKRGRGVFAYLSYGLVDDATIAALSVDGTAASFFTDVELDTYVTVARRGGVVRRFDAGFEPPTRGALAAERGLDWGAPDQNIFATAWAYLERLTHIHVSQRWFDKPHPAFVYDEQTF